MEWECGEGRRARRQRGEQGGGGVRLAGVSWALPAGPPRITVTAAGLDHRLPCWGYVFREQDQEVGGDGDQVQRDMHDSHAQQGFDVEADPAC